MDLSHPQGLSVNDSVSPTDSSMVYSTVDDAAHIISSLGRNAILAKIDISSAFHIIPVHPQDRPLLGMCWNNKNILTSNCLSGFGLLPSFFMHMPMPWSGSSKSMAATISFTIWMIFQSLFLRIHWNVKLGSTLCCSLAILWVFS